VIGQQQTYTPGTIITFSVKGIEPDGTPASQQKGFNVQAHLYNQNVGINPSFQAVNGTYNTSSGYWDVRLTAPLDVSIPYEVRISLYCGYVGFDSLCAQKYGASSAQYQTFQFRVINTTQPSITVLSPNGGEVWSVGSTQVIKWNNTSDGPVNLTLSNYLACWTATPACGAPAVLYQLANNISGSAYNWTTGKTASGGDIPAGEYKVTVSSATNGSVTDQSDSAFTITATSTTSLNPQTVQALAEFSQKKNLNLASILAAIAQLIEAFK